MLTDESVKKDIFAIISTLVEDENALISEETPLIGDGSIMDSMKLVELCVRLEDLSLELGFEFDWTSETAMSRSRSMFRNAGALAAQFLTQMRTN